MFKPKMMELFSDTFCFSAKRSPRLDVEFEHLGMASHLSVILTLPDFYLHIN